MSKTGKYSSSWTWLQKINRRWNEIIRNICSPLWFQMINLKNVAIFRKKSLKEIGSFCGLWYPWFWTWVCPEFQKGLWYPSFWTSGMPWFWKQWLDTHSACSFTWWMYQKKHPHLVLKKMLLSSASCFDRPRECHKKWSVQINVMIVSVHFWTRSMHITRQSVVNSVIAYLRFRVSIQ